MADHVTDHEMDLPDILRQQLDMLCGADRFILDGELGIFSLGEHHMDEEEPRLIPFPDVLERLTASAPQRNAA